MIRKYKDSDIDELLDVWYRASLLAHPFLDSVFMEKEKKNIREVYMPNTETWVYELNESVIGFIAMLGNEIGAIFLYPEFHGQGIGAKLMNHVADMHQELEVEVFEKNSIGRAFYAKYGFVLIKEYIHDETKNKLLRLRFKKIK